MTDILDLARKMLAAPEDMPTAHKLARAFLDVTEYAENNAAALGSLQELLAKQIVGTETGTVCAACGEWNKYSEPEHAKECPVSRGLAIIAAALEKNPNPAGPVPATEASESLPAEASGAGGAGTVTFEAQSTSAPGTVCGTSLRTQSGTKSEGSK